MKCKDLKVTIIAASYQEKFKLCSLFLFSQSTVNDPFETYAKRRQESPVYRDDYQKVWGIYSYRHCLQLLTSGDTHIPSLPVLPAGTLNDYVQTIIEHHTRLSNGTAHIGTREIAMRLYAARLPPLLSHYWKASSILKTGTMGSTG